MDFLALLRDEIRAGLRRAPEDYRARHAAWLAAQQRVDGGFPNRRGISELYYTTFGLRALSCLEALSPERAARALAFLRAETAKTRHPFRDAIGAVSWWDAARLCEEAGAPAPASNERDEARRRTREGLAALRRADGGWAKNSMEGNGSLYHSFLAALACQRMGEDTPEPARLEPFLAALADASGGFRENAYSKRPGTNATASGVALTMLLKARGLTGLLASWSGLRERLAAWASRDLAPHAAFLASMAGAEGGFQATPNAPFADLLSTYTGLFSLKNLGRLEAGAFDRARAYARGLEQDEGGYVGFLLEQRADCEYTFYGLGVESLATS
ncbi:MAG: hypothetical protein M5U26_03015 [Planctomycetota bacterium]|nr:hypothetical protein [Planctomycetota bacterium]